MEFGKQHDTTDTPDFCPCQLIIDLLFMLWTCCGHVTGKSSTCYGLASYSKYWADWNINQMSLKDFSGSL